MKLYLLNLVKKISFPKLLLIAVIIRIVLVPLSFHSDLNTNLIWGRYAQEFGLKGYYDWLNFGNYALPEYPPLSTILFLFVRTIWSWLFGFFWWLNISFAYFPSKFIPWFESEGQLSLYKIPGIIADLAIGYLIYKFVKRRSEFGGKVAASFYLFNPAVIYLSSSWGQIESLVGFFALASFLALISRKYLKSTISMVFSLMTKATMLPLLPIYFFEFFKTKPKFKQILIATTVVIFVLIIFGTLFTDHNYFIWTIRNYWKKFMFGPGNLHFINLNGFNFWGFLLGLHRISDKTMFLRVPLYAWGWILFLPFYLYIFSLHVGRRKNIFFTLILISLSAFLFLPRMHERYLFPIFVFFPLLLFYIPKLRKYFYLLSGLYLLNLYHWWWFPRIEFLVNLLSLDFVERTLSFLVVFCFFAMLKEYLNYGKN